MHLETDAVSLPSADELEDFGEFLFVVFQCEVVVVQDGVGVCLSCCVEREADVVGSESVVEGGCVPFTTSGDGFVDDVPGDDTTGEACCDVANVPDVLDTELIVGAGVVLHPTRDLALVAWLPEHQRVTVHIEICRVGPIDQRVGPCEVVHARRLRELVHLHFVLGGDLRRLGRDECLEVRSGHDVSAESVSAWYRESDRERNIRFQGHCVPSWCGVFLVLARVRRWSWVSGSGSWMVRSARGTV